MGVATHCWLYLWPYIHIVQYLCCYMHSSLTCWRLFFLATNMCSVRWPTVAGSMAIIIHTPPSLQWIVIVNEYTNTETVIIPCSWRDSDRVCGGREWSVELVFSSSSQWSHSLLQCHHIHSWLWATGHQNWGVGRLDYWCLQLWKDQHGLQCYCKRFWLWFFISVGIFLMHTDFFTPQQLHMTLYYKGCWYAVSCFCNNHINLFHDYSCTF